jgi:hypothetical protein
MLKPRSIAVAHKENIMADEQAPSFVDPAQPILAGAPSITDEDRANLWDVFHNSKDHNELVRHLTPAAIPDSLKAQLYEAKKKNAPVVEPLDKVTEAVRRVSQIDPKVLDLAESHPNVLKALTGAATTAAKEAGSTAGASKSAGKGKASKNEAEAPAVTPDVPPTPSGHALVKTHDGGLHHIPHQNIEKAKAIDPQLTVLHVEP